MRHYANFYSRFPYALAGGLILLLLFAGCPMAFRGDSAGSGREGEGREVDRPDPLAFAGDDEIVTETDIGLTDYSRISYDTTAAYPVTGAPADSTESAQLYEVRVFAALNIQAARETQQQVDTLTEMPVRVVFEEPYYKVYAGPYPTFEEAEKFLRLVTRLGFTSAWIVGRRENVGE
jgi:hypothetical protein